MDASNGIKKPRKGYRWIARKWFRHRHSGRIIRAADYGKRCFWFLVKD
jgi:hypothetical protein